MKNITKHHLIPKVYHKRKKYKKNKVDMCVDCQRFIHKTFSEKELKDKYNDVNLLKKNKKVKNWIKWLKKHNRYNRDIDYSYEKEYDDNR